jgi:hypothetical protein
VCVEADSCFRGTFLGAQHLSIFLLLSKCLSQKYLALELFIGQISSESEVFWVRVCLRVTRRKNLTVEGLKVFEESSQFPRFLEEIVE